VNHKPKTNRSYTRNSYALTPTPHALSPRRSRCSLAQTTRPCAGGTCTTRDTPQRRQRRRRPWW